MKKIAETIEEFREIDRRLKKIKNEEFVNSFDEGKIEDNNTLVCVKNFSERIINIPETLKISKIEFEQDKELIHLYCYATIKDVLFTFKFKNISLANFEIKNEQVGNNLSNDLVNDHITDELIIDEANYSNDDLNNNQVEKINEEIDKNNCTVINEEKVNIQ